MQEHPFIESVWYRSVAIAALLVILALNTLLYVYCGAVEWNVVGADSLLLAILLGASGFLYWYIADVLQAIQARIVLALLVQALCIAGSFIVQQLAGQDSLYWFLYALPIRLTIGLMGWIILIQWYYIQKMEYRQKQLPLTKNTEISASPLTNTEISDRISVKDGSRIHIIHVNELLYIQACGDYVTLFTDTGQYIKEQTMKYFETHLPASAFVRIHRSCIVNTEQIVRLELFGKETYQVRLKNGSSLRVSNTGYKLLREHLRL